MTHYLKLWPQFFEDILRGEKTFELRRSEERGFRPDDILCLQEWNPDIQEYTGREMRRRVTYAVFGPRWGLHDGWICMALGAVRADTEAGKEDE